MDMLVNGIAQNKDNIGLAGGGQKVGQCREKYKLWVENLIKLASLQTSFVTMDEALKVRTILLYDHIAIYNKILLAPLNQLLALTIHFNMACKYDDHAAQDNAFSS